MAAGVAMGAQPTLGAQPSVIPFRPTDTRDISLKRRTITGKIVKEIFFKVKSRTAPRSAKRAPGVPAPSVDDCLACFPQSEYPYWRVAWNTITCGWFYIASGENNEGMSGIYEQISLLAALFAIIVKSVLSDAKEIQDENLRGLCVIFASLSLFFLVSASFYSMAHVVLTQKMQLDAQVDAFNQLYFAPFVRLFSPIRFLQYGIHTGGIGGILWVFGFVEKAYSITFIVLFCFFMLGTWIGFLRLVFTALGVLHAEPLREGEQASLDLAAIKVLLQSYEEDCGAEFMNPKGFETFCGECLLKPGCDPTELVEFSHVTKRRMENLLEQHLSELAKRPGEEVYEADGEEAEVGPVGTVLASSVYGKTDTEDPRIVNIKSALKSPDRSPEATHLTRRSASPRSQVVDQTNEVRDQAKKSSKGERGSRRKPKKGSKVSFQGQDQTLLDSEDSSVAELTEEAMANMASQITLGLPTTTTQRHVSPLAAALNSSAEDGSQFRSNSKSPRRSKSPIRSSLPLVQSQVEDYSNERSGGSAQEPPTNV